MGRWSLLLVSTRLIHDDRSEAARGNPNGIGHGAPILGSHGTLRC